MSASLSTHPRRTLGLTLLILVTAIWGSTFAVVKDTTALLPPALLIAWRFTLGTLCLLPLLLRPGRSAPAPVHTRPLWRDGLLLGGWLILGYGTQTIALTTTSANRAAFITALSVVLVPLWLALAARRRPGERGVGGWLWLAAGLALLGLALLSWEGGRLVTGDLWALACAVTYAGFIITLERTAPHHEALKFTLVQLLAVTALAWLWAGLSGVAAWPPAASWGALLYLGSAASAATTLMQTVGQRWVRAAQASIIYALEPVAATVFSFFLLGETVGLRGLLGGGLVVLATVLSQRE
jgi:drug/metabolite transporter (DMT)-like permease